MITILFETICQFYFDVLADRSLAQHFSEAVYRSLVLLAMHVDSPNQDLNLLLFDGFDHVLIAIKAVVQNVKAFLVPVQLIATICKSDVGLHVLLIVSDAVLQRFYSLSVSLERDQAETFLIENFEIRRLVVKSSRACFQNVFEPF